MPAMDLFLFFCIFRPGSTRCKPCSTHFITASCRQELSPEWEQAVPGQSDRFRVIYTQVSGFVYPKRTQHAHRSSFLVTPFTPASFAHTQCPVSSYKFFGSFGQRCTPSAPVALYQESFCPWQFGDDCFSLVDSERYLLPSKLYLTH